MRDCLDRFGFVGAIASAIRVEIAALFELIKLDAADEKPLREQSVFARAVTARTIAQ
jgi:hypothetical protein